MAAGDLEWNYVKFLVGRDGVPRKRFNSLYNPKDFEGDVSASLHQNASAPCAPALQPSGLLCNSSLHDCSSSSSLCLHQSVSSSSSSIANPSETGVGVCTAVTSCAYQLWEACGRMLQTESAFGAIGQEGQLLGSLVSASVCACR